MAYTDLDNIQRLLDRFKRPIPLGDDYQTRLVEEFELILSQRFTDYFLRICDIIDLTEDLTHMTRGSAGSSLVCYLLGITDVDPIEWKIPVNSIIFKLCNIQRKKCKARGCQTSRCHR